MINNYYDNIISKGVGKSSHLNAFLKTIGVNEVKEEDDYFAGNIINPDLIYKNRAESNFSFSMPSVIVAKPPLRQPLASGNRSYLFETTIFSDRVDPKQLAGPWINTSILANNHVAASMPYAHYPLALESTTLHREGRLFEAFEMINGAPLEVKWATARCASWAGMAARLGHPLVVEGTFLAENPIKVNLLFGVSDSGCVVIGRGMVSKFSNFKLNICNSINPYLDIDDGIREEY